MSMMMQLTKLKRRDDWTVPAFQTFKYFVWYFSSLKLFVILVQKFENCENLRWNPRENYSVKINKIYNFKTKVKMCVEIPSCAWMFIRDRNKAAKCASMVQWLRCLPGIRWFPHRHRVQTLAREKFRYFGCFIPISVRRWVKFECESLYCLTIDKSLMTNQ